MGVRADRLPMADKDLVFARVLKLYTEGKTLSEIRDAIGFEDNRIVYDVIREAARDLRQNASDQTNQAFLRQSKMLDLMIEFHMKVIVERFEETKTLDHNAVRQLILVFDRQAKLLGLDRKTELGGDYSWMRNAGEEELRRRAEARGIVLPKKMGAYDA